MKIIDNKKDYYDYLSGVYGIDPYVVYDRRGSVASSEILESWGELFNKNVIDSDTVEYNRKYGRHMRKRAFIDKDFQIIVEVGDKHYYIRCNRRRETENSPIELTYSLYDPVEELKAGYINWAEQHWIVREIERYKKKRSNAPLAIYYTDYQRYHDEGGHGAIDNPILKDLPITGLLPAEEIWKNIYDYLLKEKEPKIVDNRTNDEHIISAGFDRKTSFRNM